MRTKTEVVLPSIINGENHWYPKALNAAIPVMVNFIFNLSKDCIFNHYLYLHDMMSRVKFVEAKVYQKFFLGRGDDYFNFICANVNRQIVLIRYLSMN